MSKERVKTKNKVVIGNVIMALKMKKQASAFYLIKSLERIFCNYTAIKMHIT